MTARIFDRRHSVEDLDNWLNDQCADDHRLKCKAPEIEATVRWVSMGLVVLHKWYTL
jgi:hypothetical protein